MVSDVNIYDPTKDSWSSGPSVSQQKYHVAAENYALQLWAEGGSLRANIEVPTVETIEFDKTSWSNAGSVMLLAPAQENSALATFYETDATKPPTCWHPKLYAVGGSWTLGYGTCAFGTCFTIPLSISPLRFEPLSLAHAADV